MWHNFKYSLACRGKNGRSTWGTRIMLDAFVALCAHANCRARAAARFREPQSELSFGEFNPRLDCEVVHFIQECSAVYGDSPDVLVLKAAHATVHSVLIGLAQKRKTGQPVNADVEFAPNSNFGAASSSLVSAIWRMERKSGSMP
jgi:hypothetical protein